MKALSLLQPWASLIAMNAKRFETRSWDTKHRGQIAICASAKVPRTVLDLCWHEPFARAFLNAHLIDEPARSISITARTLCKGQPLGCVVAVATIADTHETDGTCIRDVRDWVSYAAKDEQQFGDYSKGRYAWRLTDVRRLKQTIPVKGMLGLWTLPADVEKKVMAQL